MGGAVGTGGGVGAAVGTVTAKLEGRALDAAVAERLGWAHECQLVLGTYHGTENCLYLWPERAAYRRRSEHDGFWERWSPDGAAVIVNPHVPAYSTSLADAWALVEWLGWDCVVEHLTGWGYRAAFKSPATLEVFEAKWHDQPAEALCRAFLAATEP